MTAIVPSLSFTFVLSELFKSHLMMLQRATSIPWYYTVTGKHEISSPICGIGFGTH